MMTLTPVRPFRTAAARTQSPSRPLSANHSSNHSSKYSASQAPRFAGCVSVNTPRPDAVALLLQGTYAKRLHVITEIGSDPAEHLTGVLTDYLLMRNEFSRYNPDLIYDMDPEKRATLFNGTLDALWKSFQKGKISEPGFRQILKDVHDAPHIDTDSTHERVHLYEHLLKSPDARTKTLPGTIDHDHHHHDHDHDHTHEKPGEKGRMKRQG